MSNTQLRHQVWLKCMQMPHCSSLEALHFLNQLRFSIHQPLTPIGQTILMIAASVGSYHITKQCLVNGSDPNLKDSVGRTAVHYAASVGNLQIFQQLVKGGGDPLELTIGGESPLAKACIFCQGDIIQWYLNNCVEAFEVADKCEKKPLELLRVSGDGLYDEVYEVYYDLMEDRMEGES